MRDKEHKNPVKQNKLHRAILNRVLYNKYDIDGAVIFANLEDGSGIDSNYIFTIRKFKKWYRSLEETIPQKELEMIKKSYHPM